MKKRLIIFLAVLSCGCAALKYDMPQPTVSEYFKTTGAGFVGAVKEGQMVGIRYVIELTLVKEVNRDLFLDICFENPNDMMSPVCVKRILPKGAPGISLESPVLEGFDAKKSYGVVAIIYDKYNTLPVGKHKQFIKYHDVKL